MKKTVILCILFSVLLLSGCKGGQEEIQEFPDTPTPEYDAQNQYLLMNLMNFQETEDFFCGTDYGGMQLRYYDKKSGASGVLCPDPACTHDTGDCGANISTGASLSVYDGKLYWIAPKGEQEAALYRSDLSGANREELRTIDPQNVINAYQPQRYMIHRGFLFLVGQADVVKVMDDTGKTLYEGKLFPQPVPGLEGDPGVYGDPQAQGPEYGFALLGGDSQKLIIQVSSYMENMVDYTLMLDLTDNLKPTVLWSNEI